MSSKALIIITSAIARDAEMRYTPSGTAVCSFSVPADIGWGESKKTAWYRCSLFGDRAERLVQHLVKGMGVMVMGEPQVDENGGPRIWKDKDGNARANLEMTVSEITLLGMRAPKQNAPEPGSILADMQQGEDVPF